MAIHDLFNLPGCLGVASLLLFVGLLLAASPFGDEPPSFKAIIGGAIALAGGHLAAVAPMCWQAAAALVLWGASCLAGAAVETAVDRGTASAFYAYSMAGVGMSSCVCLVMARHRDVPEPRRPLLDPAVAAELAAAELAIPELAVAEPAVADLSYAKRILAAGAIHLMGIIAVQAAVILCDDASAWVMIGGALVFGGGFLVAVVPGLWPAAAVAAMWGAACLAAAAAARATSAESVYDTLMLCIIVFTGLNLVCWLVASCA